MVKPKDIELDQLLARGRLSGRQYDAIERNILSAVSPARRRWPWSHAPSTVLISGTALSAMGLALGVWLMFGKTLDRQPGAPPPSSATADGFRAKGATLGPVSSFELGCPGRERGVCRLGDTLLFSLNAGTPSGHVVAYAEREGEPGARVWYFPTTSGAMPRVEARAGTQVLPEGVRLGPPHSAGKYRVSLWVSEAPLTRAQAEALLAEAPRGEHAALGLEILN
jgi:hypothetical protein